MGRTVDVTFVAPDGGRSAIAVEAGATFLDAARAADIDVEATCGARGRCRGCRLKVLKGDVPPPTIMDEVQLGPDEVHEGFRLACQTRVIADAEIMPAPPRTEGGHQILRADGNAAGRPGIDLDSGVEKQTVQARIPIQEHQQTSDIEEILSAVGAAVGSDSGHIPPEILRTLPAVLRAEKGAVTVTTFNGALLHVEAGDTTAHKYGMAFDIGTTSIVGALIDLSTGEQLTATGELNPQAVYGGDLMSRLAFAQFNPQALRKLRARAVQAVNEQIKQACADAGIDAAHIYKLVVVGNTAMHHIFLGIDPTYVGLAPYAPTVRHAIELPARELLLKTVPNALVCLLPIVAGFVGADAVGAILATRIFETDETRVMVDIGTNGEVVMAHKGRLMACSAPAGPALEGAQIKHGMRGAAGAIEKVRIDDDVVCETIGDAPAVGLCGSGLIDAAAAMLSAGVLDASGRFARPDGSTLPPAVADRLIRDDGKHAFALVRGAEAGRGRDVILTQPDVRQLQLAKGAIYSGILMLQKIMGVADDEIAEIQLAGGFGNYISTESAVNIRLLPPLPLERISYVGNAALMGAELALVSEPQRARANAIARQVEHVSLAARPDFQDVFMEAMCFPEDKALGKLAGVGS